MLEDADRKLKKGFAQKLKTSFLEGGRAVAGKGWNLTVRAHGNRENN